MPVHLLQFAKLQQDPRVVHFFTEKPYNFHPDLPQTQLNQQLHKIFTQIHYTPSAIYQCVQSHSANVQIITPENRNSLDLTHTDGLITNLPGVALTTYVADCQAIFLYDPVQRVIANVHSGWRGTLQKIVQVTVTQMAEVFHCRPSDLQAYLCPSIGSCCFEIGSEVAEQFNAEFKNLAQYLQLVNSNRSSQLKTISTKSKIFAQNLRSIVADSAQKFYLDTVRLNLDLLKSLGLAEQNLTASPLCTKCHSELFHSHRAAAGFASGRNLALICLA